MPFTAQTIVDQIQVLIPGVTDAEALGYVNRAYKWLLGSTDIKTEPLEIASVQYQQGYDLSNDILRTDRVLWVTGVDAQSRYTGDELTFTPDKEVINVSYGTPTDYSFHNVRQSNAATADSKAQIWLYPIPDTDPDGGLPKIVIYGTVYRALALTDYVSNAVQFEDAILCRSKMLLFDDYDPSKSDYWEQKAAKYLRETLDNLNKRQDGLGENLIPTTSFRRRTAQ